MQADPVAVEPSCPIRDAVARMNERRIGAVLVTGDGDRLAGIFTERDLLKRIVASDGDWRDRPVSDWMTPDPYTIGPEVAWEEAVMLLDLLRVRHLPVIEDGRPIGIISTRILMARRAEHLNREVETRTRELRHANDELMARDAELRYNLRAAGRFQNRLLLPSQPPDWSELKWGVHYAPLDHLGGDYYDIARPHADHLGLLIADASGHSIAAAMVAIMSRIAFSEVSGAVNPGEVLSAMNDRLQGMADERFVTAFYGVLHRPTRTLRYCNAGHPYPMRYVARTGAVQELTASGFLLGIMAGEQYRERVVELEPGDRVCFFTDGVVEAHDERGEAFGTDRLSEALRLNGTASASELCDCLMAAQREFCGAAKLTDDVTLVVMQVD
ncbi:MAG TPA: SpoIIE family protein phosphatase [Gemmataceae bacterium]|nr:SpoIIE family protein phosphatase [Gemmataceae bacterium]